MARRFRKLASIVRPYAERVPFVMATYRGLRDRMPDRFGAAVVTPLGFKFAGFDTMTSGTFEPAETKFIVDELGASDVFVNVGANIGYFACLARFHGVHTIAIEPHDANLRLAYRNLRANGWTDRLEVFPVAVAESPGLLDLFGVSTGASLVPGWAGASRLNVRTVAVSTLDIILQNRFEGQRLLIKIDVEGAELHVLKGALSTLVRNPRPRWLVEVCLTENQSSVNPYFAEVFELFAGAGYHAFTVEERRRVGLEDVARWTRDGARDFGSYNFLFLPA